MPTPNASADKASLRVGGLCFLILFLEGYDVSSLGYATPSLIEAWHTSAPRFTATVTMGACGMLLGSLCGGLLGDRLGRKPVLMGCVGIFGLSTLLTAGTAGLVSLTVLRCLACLGLGGGVPLTIALATDCATATKPRRLVILMSTGLAVGSTAGGFLSHRFVSTFGWEAIFLFGGALPLLLLPFLLVFLPESQALHVAASLPRRASPVDLFGTALRRGPSCFGSLIAAT